MSIWFPHLIPTVCQFVLLYMTWFSVTDLEPFSPIGFPAPFAIPIFHFLTIQLLIHWFTNVLIYVYNICELVNFVVGMAINLFEFEFIWIWIWISHPEKSNRLMVMLFKCICRRLVLQYAHTSGCDMGSALIHMDGRYTGDNVIL